MQVGVTHSLLVNLSNMVDVWDVFSCIPIRFCSVWFILYFYLVWFSWMQFLNFSIVSHFWDCKHNYALCSNCPLIFPSGSDGKAFAHGKGDLGLIPGSKRSPGEGNGYPRQYSCLENPMGREVWQATVHGGQKVRHDWEANTYSEHGNMQTHGL